LHFFFFFFPPPPPPPPPPLNLLWDHRTIGERSKSALRELTLILFAGASRSACHQTPPDAHVCQAHDPNGALALRSTADAPQGSHSETRQSRGHPRCNTDLEANLGARCSRRGQNIAVLCPDSTTTRASRTRVATHCREANNTTHMRPSISAHHRAETLATDWPAAFFRRPLPEPTALPIAIKSLKGNRTVTPNAGQEQQASLLEKDTVIPANVSPNLASERNIPVQNPRPGLGGPQAMRLDSSSKDNALVSFLGGVHTWLNCAHDGDRLQLGVRKVQHLRLRRDW
jgi:hypothetical protein